MADEFVGCICSSLAGLMGAVGNAITSANQLSTVTDVLPAGGDASATGAAGTGGEQYTATEGLSPTYIASIILILLAALFSAFRSTPELPAKARNEGANNTNREDDADPPTA